MVESGSTAGHGRAMRTAGCDSMPNGSPQQYDGQYGSMVPGEGGDPPRGSKGCFTIVALVGALIAGSLVIEAVAAFPGFALRVAGVLGGLYLLVYALRWIGGKIEDWFDL